MSDTPRRSGPTRRSASADATTRGSRGRLRRARNKPVTHKPATPAAESGHPRDPEQDLDTPDLDAQRLDSYSRHPEPETSRLRRQAAAGRIFVPSAVTVLAICAGLTALRSTLHGHIDMALALVVVAAILDAVDGRVARMMNATTRMGAEIDSLADVINFGVVPGGIVYLALLGDVGNPNLTWIFVLIYVCAIVLRLARFNTLLDDDDAPAYTKEFFVGVPAPAAAILVLLPVGLHEQFGTGWWTSDAAVGGWMVVVAALAVSRIPTASTKATKVQPSSLAILLIGVAVTGALLLTYPYVLMVVLIAAYLAHIPFAWRNQRWVAARPEQWDARPADRRAERRADRIEGGGRRRMRPSISRSHARLGLRRPGDTTPHDPTDP
ncbi:MULTISPECIES: CDP-alcohol phosphatidyltransferase family protein [Gordonia]|jgi:CDP-diacylglycerol--serine O-phosphatidyltransferase|uniref:CDP-alcohol phosphatidyltransferase family protein n=1 Tax=Gordonia TaxID=2053 RepID=UPI001FED15E7|nr:MULTISPECIES: phosphatidylcholine/phosphatidylserine synthase [Gordonia]